jgi:ribosomal protein S18 acetylase RimI-like enzyme
MEIKLAKDLNENISYKISELYVEGFGENFIAISNDPNKLINAFSHMFVLDYFYVCIINNEIAGIAACVDKEHLCIKHDKKEFIKHLGLYKGLLANMIFKKNFYEYPKYEIDIDCRTGSIENVITNKKYRKMGVASSIMEHIFSLKLYQKYILEVYDTNQQAYNLYRKLGFCDIGKSSKNIPKHVGINYNVYMLKNIN